MENYKPNSFRSKQKSDDVITLYPEKNVKKAVRGRVRKKEKNTVQKLADVFIAEDIKNVKEYIILDVVVPLIKKAITEGIETVLYGRDRGKSSSAPRVSYGGCYKERESDRKTVSRRSVFDYDDLIFDSYGEAEDVLCLLGELIEKYGFASVADLYDLAGMSGPYTADKYGWTDISSGKVVRYDGGYELRLPKAMPID